MIRGLEPAFLGALAMALVAAVAPDAGLEIRLAAAFLTSIAVYSLRPFLGYALGIDLVIGLTIGLVVGLGLHPMTLILGAAALAHDPDAFRSSIVGLTRAIALGYPHALLALPPALALGLAYALVRHGAVALTRRAEDRRTDDERRISAHLARVPRVERRSPDPFVPGAGREDGD